MTPIEVIEEGCRTMAMLHADLFDFGCDGCAMQEQLNCAGLSVDEPVFYEDVREIEFYQCPISAIPRCVIDALNNRAFRREFNSARQTSEVPWLEWHILNTYDRFAMQLRKKERQRANT